MATTTIQTPKRGPGRPRTARQQNADEGVGATQLLERDDQVRDVGGDTTGNHPPVEPPSAGRGDRWGRPDPPPMWARIALYIGCLLLACALGKLVSIAWVRADKAIWGNGRIR